MPEKNRPLHLEWEACYNVRDLGAYLAADGKPVRQGMIVRADNLHNLTEAGLNALREYGIRTIIDLRMTQELELHPDPFAAHVDPDEVPRYMHLPLQSSESNPEIDAAAPFHGEYIVIIEKHKPLAAAVIRAVASGLEQGGVLVHCFAGKDRTGIITALLLTLAGVPREVIVEDYMLSESRAEPSNLAWLEDQSKALGHPIEKPQWMYMHPQRIISMLEHLDNEYGGVEGFLMAVGVEQADIERIRTHLLSTSSD